MMAAVASAGRWRKEAHIAFVACALLLRWLPFAGVVACAVGALIFNLFVLPRIRPLAHVLFRDDEQAGRPAGGIFWYPVAVLVLVVAFPLPVAAAGWGMLAVGDGAATLVGQRVSSPRVPWNPGKSVGGTAALVLCGTAAGVLLFWWVRGNGAGYPPWWRDGAVMQACTAVSWGSLVVRMVCAGLVAALLESLPLRRVDDNMLVPLSSGAVLLASFMV